MRRDTSPKGGEGHGEAERTPPAPQAAPGRAVGHKAYMGIMILALAVRHRAERPAMSMEGGTRSYGAASPAAI